MYTSGIYSLVKNYDGADGRGISGTSVTYQVGSSGVSAPTGTWTSAIPTVEDGEYLWVRTIWTYTDGTTETMYSVSYQGADGADGTSVNILGTAYTSETEYTAGNLYTLYSDSALTKKLTGESGDAYLVDGYLFVYSETDGAFVCTGVIRGEDGTGIVSIVNYYLASAASSGVDTSTSGWTTGIQAISADKPYLWNYEVVALSDGNSDITTPCIIGAYGDTGVGIKSVVEYYAVSASNSTAPTGWSTTVQTMSETNKYLWNYEVITYTDGTTSSTDKRVIGVYGETGNGIASVLIYYALGSSGTTQPSTPSTSTWSTDMPTVGDDDYLWAAYYVTYTDGTTAWVGVGCLTDDSTRQRTTTLETELEVVQGQITSKIWQTDITEAVSNITIGSRNYLLGTKTFADSTTIKNADIADTTYQGFTVLYKDNSSGNSVTTVCEWTDALEADGDTDYTLSFYAKGSGTMRSQFFGDDDTVESGTSSQGTEATTADGNIDIALSDDWARYWVTWHTLSGISGTRSVRPMRLTAGSVGYICGIKLEKGNVATDWSPAPEDAEASITTLQDQYTIVTETLSGITAEVGDLTTTVSDYYSELSGKVTSIETTVSGIETSISDFDEYVSENYTSLNDKLTTVSETVDGIEASISDIQTVVTDNYESLSSSITALTATTDGITAEVSNLQTTVSDNYSELAESIATVKATTDEVSSTVSNLTTTVDDNYTDLSSKISSITQTVDTITTQVSTIESTVSDNYDVLDSKITTVSQTADGIISSVSSIQTWVDNVGIGGTNLLTGTKDFSGAGGTHTDTGDVYQGCSVVSCTKASSSTYVTAVSWGTIDVIPEQYYTLSFWAKADDEATIRSYFYPDCCETAESSTGGTGTSADGAVETTIGTSWARYWVTWKTLSTADGEKNVLPVRLYTTTTIYIAGVKLEYGNIATAWSPAPEDTEESISSVESQISQLASEITLSVDGGLGSTATISITYGSNTSSEEIDLSDIRKAFANDDTSVTISAGTITFASNTLIIDSDDFTLDASGNASFSGTLSAPTGTLGGWTIDSTAIYKWSPVESGTESTQYQTVLSAPDTPAASDYAMYIAHRTWSGSAYGSRTYDFYLRYDGYMYAAGGGKIGAWTLGSGTSGALYSGSCSSVGSTKVGTYIGTDGYWQYASSNAHVKIADGVLEAKGGVFYGEVTATSGTFTGTIKAGAGSTLGGWTLNEDSISSDKITITADSFNFSDGSSVTFGSDDSTTTIDGETGDITTTSGTFATGGTITTKLSDDDETYVSIIGDSIYLFDMGAESGASGVIEAVSMTDFYPMSESTSHGLYIGAGVNADFVTLGYANGDYYGGGITVYKSAVTAELQFNCTYKIEIWNSTVIYGDLILTGSLITPYGFSLNATGADINAVYLDDDNNLAIGNTDYVTAIYGSSIMLNGDTYNSSDARLKTDFAALADYSGVFDQLLPVSYRFRESPDKIHFGFTTQDTAEALKAYGYDADDYALLGHTTRGGEEYGTLAYTEIIALLVHEVQQLKAQIRR